MQLLVFIDRIVNSPLQTDIIYLDISKAFDTVSNGILLEKLWSIGITGVLWSWFKNYLTNRYQRVLSRIVTLNYYQSFRVCRRAVYLHGPLLFLVYINDMSSYIQHSQILKFADDTKCFNHISSISDQNILQEDIDALFTWSRDSDLNFNLKKFVHLSFKSKFNTTYNMSDACIPCMDSHNKDLGIILSEDLSWGKCYKSITAHAYKVLGLIRRTFLPSRLASTMVKLYVSLVQSQLFYCTQIWRPHLMKDILSIERVQHCVTKYIVNDYTNCYKTHLIKLTETSPPHVLV